MTARLHQAVVARLRRIERAQRVVDLFGAAAALLLLLPLIAVLAAAVKLGSRGPALFGQQRVGRGGRLFTLWKLRTMVVDAEQRGPRLTGRDDPRITRLGRLLRKSKQDELPQLWNVLRGDMSLVGPRPEVPELVAQSQDAFAKLLLVRPGLISEATLKFRDEESLLPADGRTEFYVRVILPQKTALDLAWLEARTFAGDVELLARAALIVLRLRNDLGRLELPGGHLLRLGAKLALDGAVAAGAWWIAMVLRFDGVPVGVDQQRLVMLAAPIALITMALSVACGSATAIWRCFDAAQFWRLALHLLPAHLALATWRANLPDRLQLLRAPWSVIALSYLLALLAAAVMRRAWTAATARAERRTQSRPALVGRVAIVGAGRIAHQVVHELERAGGQKLKLLACFDDDLGKQRSRVAGVAVRGTLADLPAFVARERPDHLLIAIAALPAAKLRPLIDAAALAGCAVKIVPSLLERAHAPAAALRDLKLDDLIGRPPVRLDPSDATVASAWRGKTLLVTGAAGSIGSELVRQLVALAPKRLVLVDKDENGLFELGRELDDLAPDLRRELVLLHLRDRRGLARLLRRTRPDAVLHAAAHKHVPLMEENVVEAVANNALGTRDFARLASAAGVRAFVLISTDKAVRPSSVMGATKRAAELAVRDLAARASQRTRFCVVRFGNVLASRGSVIETFLRQLARGDPFTITHPQVERYFLSIPEAAQLVLVAGALERPEGLYVLEMGAPRRIVDLARDLARLTGAPARFRFVGLRPGEKLKEELSCSGRLEPVAGRSGLQVDREPPPARATVEALYRELHRAVRRGDADAARRALACDGVGLASAPVEREAAAEVAVKVETKTSAPIIPRRRRPSARSCA
ncbi:MAG: NAD-dependent epimerase/dehydratase family protein [Planctomycetes bacterium]|nr:NAD-dependent epimerase/dehydratase family protein [Planctomycetota bacterium]